MAQNNPSIPGLTSTQRRCFYAAYAGIAVAATYYMRLGTQAQYAGQFFEEIMKGSDFRFPDTDVVLRRKYTGVSVVDGGLAFLVAAFLPAASGWTPGMQLQLVYFLLSFTSVVTTWSIESVRARNKGAVITFTTIWACIYQVTGAAIIAPLYYACYTFTSSHAAFWTKSQAVPLAEASSLLPALVVGYVVPTLMFVYPVEDIQTMQGITAFWQIAPMLVNAIWLPCSYFSGSAKGDKQKQLNANRSYLDRIYAVSFFITLVTHVAMLYICFTSDDPTLSLDFIFVPKSSGPPSMRAALFYIFQIDLIGIFVATLLWCFQLTLELINMGRAPFGSLYAIVGILLGTVVLGPGAFISAVFWWREHQIEALDQSCKRL